MALISFSITLEPGTSLEDAQHIHNALIETMQRHMKWHGQEKAIIGSSLDVVAEGEPTNAQ